MLAIAITSRRVDIGSQLKVVHKACRGASKQGKLVNLLNHCIVIKSTEKLKKYFPVHLSVRI